MVSKVNKVSKVLSYNRIISREIIIIKNEVRPFFIFQIC